ncbi:alpha/beta hydrolase fold protein [Actinobacillus equuli]|nr:alpha/beta hydrolase fold protein [Actinobacillus equuli]
MPCVIWATGNSYISSIAYGNNRQAGHYQNVGDTQIYYEIYGSGKPVVVLHGGLVGSIAEMGQFIDNYLQIIK